ncbi:hypothetical protein [Aquihabitans sp. McL0605]|uniref:hypothetical protein n=1 Tax=Aquihabitans sp. McL0605 TaxID=3415671 RepID=UPI003CEEDF6F
MIRSNKHHPLAMAAAALVATMAIIGLATTPAGADPVDSDTLVFVPYNGQTFTIWRNGNISQPTYGTTQQTFPGVFDGNPGTDLFLYNPGSGADGILHITPSGSSFTSSFKATPVSGTYTPLVGDFDGNAIDDIFWYAPGAAADSLWLFKANGTHITKSVSVSGTYRPLAINTDGDGYTDIIWYAPGSAADSIWRFGPNGNHTTKALSIAGDYQLIPGYFGLAPEGSPQRRIIFFNKAGADSIWTFDSVANHISEPLPNIDGSFQPVVGNFLDKLNDSVLFYRPGTASERFITFDDDGNLEQLEPPTVKGTYDHTVGDFDGNGYADIAWSSGGKATLWKFNGGGYSQATITTNTTNTTAAVVKSFLYSN